MSFPLLHAPSPSPSPSPSPLSPFSRLPNELVQTIIESTIPRSFNRSTYNPRRSTLYSLCLVSKLFHQIAKPLLYAVVYRSYISQADFDKPLISRENGRSEGSVGGLIREIVVESSETLPDKFMDAIRHKVGLRSLVLNLGDIGSVDLADLSELSNLTTLQLSNASISVSTFKPLFNLRTLNLLDIWVAPDGRLPQLLNPTLFPSLTSLAYYGGYSDGASKSDALGLLVQQLESVSLDASIIGDLPSPLLARLKEFTTFDQGHIRDLFIIPVTPFIRLYDFDAWSCERRQAFATLAEWIMQNARLGLPSVLYLPTSLNKGDSLGKDKLENECKRKKIEIVFEEEPEDWHLESGISEDFSRRMKERKLAPQET